MAFTMDEILRLLSKAYGYPESLVKEAYLASTEKTVDEILEYCDNKVKEIHEKQETT